MSKFSTKTNAMVKLAITICVPKCPYELHKCRSGFSWNDKFIKFLPSITKFICHVFQILVVLFS